MTTLDFFFLIFAVKYTIYLYDEPRFGFPCTTVGPIRIDRKIVRQYAKCRHFYVFFCLSKVVF